MWLLCLQEWLINEKQLDVFGMKLPTGFQLIGQVVRILKVVHFHTTLPSKIHRFECTTAEVKAMKITIINSRFNFICLHRK